MTELSTRNFSAEKYPCSKIMPLWDRRVFIHTPIYFYRFCLYNIYVRLLSNDLPFLKNKERSIKSIFNKKIIYMKNKGFTLIELLVVIAIIGILSSVVLASLNTARGKGANAAVKANLNNIRAQAEVFYDSNSNYTNLCTTDTTVARGVTAAGTAGGGTGVCRDSANAWAASAPLRVAEGTSTNWCVDSTGNSKGLTAALGTGVTACP